MLNNDFDNLNVTDKLKMLSNNLFSIIAGRRVFVQTDALFVVSNVISGSAILSLCMFFVILD